MIKLINDDCLKALFDIPDKSVNLILCDLPYGVVGCKWDKQLPLDFLWQQFYRVLKDRRGTILHFAQEPFGSQLIQSNMQNFKQELIWNKLHHSGPLQAKRQHLKCHEKVLVFQKCSWYNPQMISVEIKHKTSICCGKKGQTHQSKIYKKYYGSENYEWKDKGLRYPQSILEYKIPFKGRTHPTQKPTDLLEYLIKTYSNEGDMVLDPTMGSGSTGVACKILKRDFIGIEMDEKYFKIAEENVNTRNNL